MANDRSIPKNLEDTIIRRWITGQSPEQIAEWIIATNRRRKAPVDTSRSSIERLLAGHLARDHKMPRLRVSLEACREVTRHYARLQEIRAEYTRLQAEEPAWADEKEARLDRARLSRRLQLLGREEQSLTRALRLAGVGPKLLDSDDLEVVLWDADVEASSGRTVDEELARATAGRTVAALAALPDETPAEAEKSVRLDAGSTGESSESEITPVGPAAAAPPVPAEVPFIKDPEWTLTPEQDAEWQQTKATVHAFLLAIWGYNGETAPEVRPLKDLVPPSPDDRAALRIAELVPALTLPSWPLTKAQTHHLEQQMKRVNAWIAWFRDALHETADCASWGPDAATPDGRVVIVGFTEP